MIREYRYYINLTNGIEYLKDNEPDNYSFVRIQSTACEQKLWKEILADLDYNFLMDLAVGNICIIVDFSAKKIVPRSIYQGVEWIKFVLYKIWFDEIYEPNVKGYNCLKYFESEYNKIKKDRTIKKIKYLKRFVQCKNITIFTETGKTQNDGNYYYYAKILRKAS